MQAETLSNHYTGGKYVEGMDVAAIAKAYRQDVKKAQAAAKLVALGGKVSEGTDIVPDGMKLSVRISRFSGGSSIDVEITAMPEGWATPYTQEYLAWHKAGHYRTDGYRDGSRYTPEFQAAKDKLEAMLKAYNFDRSDSMTDYFHQRFYQSFYVASALGTVETYYHLVK